MENDEMKQEPVSKDEEALAKGGKRWAKGGPQGICCRNFKLLKLKLFSFFRRTIFSSQPSSLLTSQYSGVNSKAKPTNRYQWN